MTEDEQFFAWLDGEIDGAEAAEVEARVAADPALLRLAEQHRALQSRLGKAFATVGDAPVPDRLVAAATAEPAPVIDLADRRRSSTAPRFAGVPQWAAIAATLVFGVIAGTFVPDRSGAPVDIDGGALYAGGNIADALDTQLASAPSGDVRIGLTFRNSEGAICRSFTGSAATGLACRDGDRWRLRGMFAAPEGQGGGYRMASGMNPGLAALLDSTLTGEPFGAEEEKAAAERGWR